MNKKIETECTDRVRSIDASALMISASNKAGMDGVERDRINSIILRESGQSSFMVQQQKKDQNVNKKIEKMRQRLIERESHPSFSSWENENESSSLRSEVNRLIQMRRPSSSCVVIDMDSFYFSCEVISKPELNNVPACVGKSMILTSNYCARRYGVRSAMPGFIADKLVSELSNGREKLLHLPANFELYRKMSDIMKKTLSEYDPFLKSYSLDEAYLNIGPYLDLRIGKGWSHERSSNHLLTKSKRSQTIDQTLDNEIKSDIVKSYTQYEKEETSFSGEISLELTSKIISEMRENVKKSTNGLTCSAGVAPNFLLAKIASDMNKPNGQLCIPHDHKKIMHFLRDLPVRKISGIGRVTEKMLDAFNIRTGAALFQQRAKIQFLFTPSTAKFLLRASLGWSDEDEETTKDTDASLDRKGISRERTFSPQGVWSKILEYLNIVAQSVSKDMQDRNLIARTVTLKVKLKSFEVVTKCKSLSKGQAFNSFEDIIPVVLQLLIDIKRECSKSSFVVRLLGVRCSNFLGADDQKALSIMKRMTIQKYLLIKDSNNSKKVSNKHKESTIYSQENNEAKIIQSIDHEQSLLKSPVDAKIFNKSSLSNGPRSKSLFGHKNLEKNNIRLFVKRNTHQHDKNIKDFLIEQKVNTESIEVQHIGSQTLVGNDENCRTFDNQSICCPICNKCFEKNENDLLNQHIDACLNGSLVRKLVKQDSKSGYSQVAKRRKCLAQFFEKG